MSIIQKIISQHVSCINEILSKEEQIIRISEICVDSISKGGKLIFCGNGGSAADSIHISSEFVGKFQKKRKALPAISLNENISSITSIANDYGYEFIFSRQIEGLGSQNDILFGLSTSGNSENVIQGLTSAKELGIKTIGMTGKKIGRMAKIDANELIIIDSDNTARIQEAHLLIGHIICQYVENKLF